MSFFLGEVVRWTPGDDYALVKPVFGINDGHVHTLSPRELEIEFLDTKKVAWHQPGKRCQVGKKVLFKKDDSNQSPARVSRHRFGVDPIVNIVPVTPEIVIPERLSLNNIPNQTDKNLQQMATALRSSGAHEFGQDFRVFLKRDNHTLDYFGPFEQHGGSFDPPQNLCKIKRYEVISKGLTTVYLDELGLEILKPSLTLRKKEEIPIIPTTPSVTTIQASSQPDPHPEHVKTPINSISLPSQKPTSPSSQRASSEPMGVSVALQKLQSNLPINGLRHDLKFLIETLQNAKALSDSEKELLNDALLEGVKLGEEVQRLLPILHEHVDFAGYFDKELEVHKKKAEQQIKNDLEQRLDAAMGEVLQEQERVRGERENLAREQERLSALVEEHRRASEQLEAKKKELRVLQASPATPSGLHAEPGILVEVRHSSPSLPSIQTVGGPIEPSDAMEILRAHPPMARLQAAWSAGRVPLACGPKSLRLMKRYAELMCGGLMRWVSINPLLTEARDLIGTFHEGWFRPHPSGIASLLLKASQGDQPTLIVMEGANRAPLELVLEPLLHSRESGLPLFAPEAFRPDDPWQILAQTPWPKSALIGCTLTTGQASQPISPILWDRLMAVDEFGWPKKEPTQNTTYIPFEQFFGLATPSNDRDTEDAIHQFQEDVVDSKWAIPGAIKLAGLMEDLGIPNAAIDTFVLSLGCAALCAGAEVESDSLAEHDTQRLERLHHYLI